MAVAAQVAALAAPFWYAVACPAVTGTSFRFPHPFIQYRRLSHPSPTPKTHKTTTMNYRTQAEKVNPHTRACFWTQYLRQTVTVYQEAGVFAPKEYTFKVQSVRLVRGAHEDRCTVGKIKVDLAQFCNAETEPLPQEVFLQLKWVVLVPLLTGWGGSCNRLFCKASAVLVIWSSWLATATPPPLPLSDVSPCACLPGLRVSSRSPSRQAG